MFRMRNLVFTLASATACLLTVTQAFGQLQINWNTVDGGGAMSSTGGTFAIAGTIGQPDASSFTSPMTGGAYSLIGGFWPVAVPTCSLPGDMDLDTHRNGVDVQGFVNCLLGVGGTNCPCADISGNGTIGSEDVALFIAMLLVS